MARSTIDDGVPVSFLLDGIHAAGLEEALRAGLSAAVEMYYRNYTDATELDTDTLDMFDQLIEATAADVDLEDLVREAEERVNSSGGITSATDGSRHRVQTFQPEDES